MTTSILPVSKEAATDDESWSCAASSDPGRPDTQPPSISPSQETEQDHAGKDEEDMTPGAVQVPGMNLMESTGFQEDDLKMAEEDSTIHIEEMNRAESTRMILEAHLVLEEDTEEVAQSVREEIEEETRQKLI